MELGARNFKRLSLEAGGKAPVLVFPDANLEKAMDAVAVGIFLYAGQSCTAGSRLLAGALDPRPVPRRARWSAPTRCASARRSTRRPSSGRWSRAPARPRARLRRARPDRGRAPPPRRRAARRRVVGRPLHGARRSSTTSRPSMTIAREEIFGPVLSVMPFDARTRRSRSRTTASSGSGSAVWTSRPRPGDPAGPPAPRRRRLGEHPLRPPRREPVRRRQAERHRARARDGRPRRLPRVEARVHRQLADVPHPLTVAAPRRLPAAVDARARTGRSRSRSTAARSKGFEGEPLAVACSRPGGGSCRAASGSIGRGG